MTSPTVKDGWIGNCLWRGRELVVYLSNHTPPPHYEYLDNLSRMLCPVSPVDFMDDALDRRFLRYYEET